MFTPWSSRNLATARICELRTGVAGGKRRLMKYHDLPGLCAEIEITDQPVAQNRWIRGKPLRRLGIERRVVQLAVEEVRVGVQKHEVGAAGVERKVVHVVYLLRGALPCVNRCGSTEGGDSRGRSVRRAFETEDHPVGCDRIGVPSELRIDARRSIERKVVIVKVCQRVAAVGVAGETPRAVAA